jgi:SAM-dependent methyltransferase
MDVARQRLAGVLPTQPLLVLGDAVHLPFRDEAFTCLLCTYTLECLPAGAIAAALDEARRVLRPGGRAVFAGLTEGESDDAALTDEWRRGFERDPEYYGGARPLQLLPLLDAAKLEIVERRYSGHGAGWPSEVVVVQKRA